MINKLYQRIKGILSYGYEQPFVVLDIEKDGLRKVGKTFKSIDECINHLKERQPFKKIGLEKIYASRITEDKYELWLRFNI